MHGKALAGFAAGALHVDHPTLTLSICLTLDLGCYLQPESVPNPNAQSLLRAVRGVRVLTLSGAPLHPKMLISSNLAGAH